MYDILIKKDDIINKKNFFIGLIISALVNFFILSMFALMSKIVKPAELPKEPIIRFVEIKEEPVEIKKSPAPPAPQKKSTKEIANIPGENKAKIIPKNERKPVKTPKGKEIKRKIVKPQKKAVVPPKEKKLTKPKKKESQKKVITPKKPTPPKPKPKPKQNVSNSKNNSMKAKENKRPTLPPPPEKPDIDLNAKLEPVNNPNVKDLESAKLDNIKDLGNKEVNTGKLAQGLKTVKPGNARPSFGEPLKKFDKNVEGTGASRKIEHMPPPPLIKTKLPAPPKFIKVKIWISPDGTVERAVLLRKTGDPLLDRAILKYIYSWKFNPISSNEVQWAVVTVKFKPNN